MFWGVQMTHFTPSGYAPAYFRANAIVCETKVIKKYNSLTSTKVGYIIISKKKAIDIDTEEDFENAKH